MPKDKVLPTKGVLEVHVGWSSGRIQVGLEPVHGRTPLMDILDATVSDVALAEKRSRALLGIGSELDGIAREYVACHPDQKFDFVGLADTVFKMLDEELTEDYTGIWSHLDRTGVNRLIRLLRKARDAAFGSDE